MFWCTVMHHVALFQSKANRVYDYGPIDYNGAEEVLFPINIIAVLTS